MPFELLPLSAPSLCHSGHHIEVTFQAVAEQLTEGGHLSYVYVPGLSIRSPANTVLLYEQPTNHGTDGINVLHVDGSVDWIPRGQARDCARVRP